jgi:uncharacterized protein YecT (DUF1311 family)
MPRLLVAIARVGLATLVMGLAGAASAQSQSELGDAAHRSYQQADAELNRVYQQLAATHDAGYRAGLVASERAWVRFRDAQCDWQTIGTEGGTIRPMLVSNCLRTLTVQRTAELRRMLNCADGDMDCTAP